MELDYERLYLLEIIKMENYENLDLKDLDGEIWKEIEGYDGDYFVSNLGRVKSFKKCRGTNVRILKQHKDNDGYLCVNLCKNGEYKPIRIYILMVENHIGKIPEEYEVHHKDFTKNDFLENFQIMTKGEHSSIHHKNKIISEETKRKQSETMKEKYKNGELKVLMGENHPMFGKHPSEETRQLIGEKQKGENNSNSTLKEQKVIKIRIDLDEGILTQEEIGEKFGVKQAQISKIKNRKTWKHLK